MTTQVMTTDASEKEVVLTKAILNIANSYGLSGKQLSEILGLSESTTTRLQQGKKRISPYTKEGEMALLLVRVYRSLNALLGNNHDKARTWLISDNRHLNTAPIEKIKTIAGLVEVVNYLDAMRGKV